MKSKKKAVKKKVIKKKLVSEFEEKLEEKKKNKTNFGFSYPEKTLIGGVNYIREDKAVEYTNSIPEEVKNSFLVRRQKRKWFNPKRWFGYKYGEEVDFEPKGNMLWLMDNEGNIRIFDKVPSGYFRINDEYKRGEKGTLNDKYLILKPNKLRTIIFEDEEGGNEKYWKAWICDINNINALPEDPMYDCENVSELVNKAVIGNREFNFKRKESAFAKFLPWIFLVLGGLALIYFAINRNLFGLGDMLGVTGKAVSQATAQVVNNVTNGSIPGGTLN